METELQQYKFKPRVDLLYSFILGVILELLAIGSLRSKELGAIYLCAFILPGVAYSLFLVNGYLRNGYIALFVVIGGTLNIGTAISCLGMADALGRWAYFATLAVSCTLFFLTYYIFISRNMYLYKGLALAFAAGLLTGILPMAAEFFGKQWDSTLRLALFFSSFPVWLTLFTLTIKLSAKPEVEVETPY